MPFNSPGQKRADAPDIRKFLNSSAGIRDVAMILSVVGLLIWHVDSIWRPIVARRKQSNHGYNFRIVSALVLTAGLAYVAFNALLYKIQTEPEPSAVLQFARHMASLACPGIDSNTVAHKVYKTTGVLTAMIFGSAIYTQMYRFNEESG